MRPSVRRLVAGMLTEHGIDEWALDRDRRMDDRLRVTFDNRGCDCIMPGPRFLASAHRTTDIERDVRLHWSIEVAEGLRRRQFGKDVPAHGYMVPTVARAVAIAAGWSPEGMLGNCGVEAFPRLRPADTRLCRHSERKQGQPINDLTTRRRIETPAWFLHMKIEMHHSREFPVERVDHRSITLRDLPETLRLAIPGQPLHRVLDLPGIVEGTPAGDHVVRTFHGNTIVLPQMWSPAGDPPAGADMRWVNIALQAAFTKDDGTIGMN